MEVSKSRHRSLVEGLCALHRWPPGCIEPEIDGADGYSPT